MKFFKKILFKFSKEACQRKYSRKPTHFAVKCKDTSEDIFKFAFVKNISIGGLLIATACKISEDTLLKIKFPFCVLQGKIVHAQNQDLYSKEFLYGIEFIGITDEHKDILSRFFQLT